jgi:hypothetical protein
MAGESQHYRTSWVILLACSGLIQIACNEHTVSSDLLLSDAQQPPGNPSDEFGGNNNLVTINNGPAGDSGITIDDRRIALDSAVADIWGFSGSHYNVNFTLTNGDFVIEPTEIDGEIHSLFVPDQASAVFYAEMYYPGEGFNVAKFQHAADDNTIALSSQLPVFANSHVGFDVNGSGVIEIGEHYDIVAGSITFSGTLPDLELRFSVALDNGQIAMGHYDGLFDFTQR